jgi:hypothetical protein
MKMIEDLRYLQDTFVRVFNEKGQQGLHIYCVMSNVALYSAYYLVYEQIKDEHLLHEANRLLRFYGYKEITPELYGNNLGVSSGEK